MMDAVKQLLNNFHNIANSPDKQLKEYLKQGKKVIACAPVYTPEEIVHSMGMIPFGTWGADIELKESKSYFPAFNCSIVQSILELGKTGVYDGISAIIVPSLCDTLKCLGENWKYAVPGIPFIPMTYPQNRKPDYGIAFVKAGYERVINDLEKNTGLKFDDASLAKSIKVYNEHNAVMREVSDLLSDYPSITASERKDVFKSAYFMTKEEHTALVKELIFELKKLPKNKEEKIKVITSGILADNPNLLSIFDENNIQIVGDDIAHESRQYRTDIKPAETALDGLAVKFSEMDNCSVLYDVDKKRADYIINMAKDKKANGVIILMTKFCDPEEFDYVIIKRACDQAEIPCLQIEVDRQMINYGQAKTLIQTFKENL